MDTSGVTYVKETVLSHPDIHSVPHITVWTSQGSGRRLDCVAFWGVTQTGMWALLDSA